MVTDPKVRKELKSIRLDMNRWFKQMDKKVYGKKPRK
jgi:hypothetical protein